MSTIWQMLFRALSQLAKIITLLVAINGKLDKLQAAADENRKLLLEIRDTLVPLPAVKVVLEQGPIEEQP